MPQNTANEVVVYHDETKNVAGGKYKGHVLYFVPTKKLSVHNTPMFGTEYVEYSPTNLIYQKIISLRHEHHMEKKLHFSNIGGKKWGSFDLGVRRYVEIGTDSLKHKFPKYFQQPMCCKLAIIFYPSNSDLSLYGGKRKVEQELRHDETILRMLLKGAANYLFEESNQVVITKLISDGNPYHRELDADRLIWRITYDGLMGKSTLSNYVTFLSGTQIVHLPSDHKLHEVGTEDHIHANMLQMADLLLGSVIRSCFSRLPYISCIPKVGSEQYSKKDIIAYPVRDMLEKTKRGKSFINSGHYNSFAISQVNFTDGSVDFTRVSPMSLEIDPDTMAESFLQIIDDSP